MHSLAYIYHWERDTVWSLPRNERKMWIEQIKEQRKAEQSQIDESGTSSPSSNYSESY